MGVLENRDLWEKIAELIATIAQGGSGVTDVKVVGTSVVDDGVANIPVAASDRFGVVKIGSGGSIQFSNSYQLKVNAATSANIKNGTESSRPIAPELQHESAFYGFAKAAGDTTQKNSSNAVGTYTDDAKQSIKEMLGITCFIPVTYADDAYTSDYDYDDIIALIGKGCYCVAVLNGEYLPLNYVDTANSRIDFISTVVAPNGVISHAISFTTSGITYSTLTYPIT